MGARCRLQAPGWSHSDPQRTLEASDRYLGTPGTPQTGLGRFWTGFQASGTGLKPARVYPTCKPCKPRASCAAGLALTSVAEGRGPETAHAQPERASTMAQMQGNEPDVVDFGWDEDRMGLQTGPRTPESLLSFPEDGAFVTATLEVLPWEDCGVHDTARKVIPSIFIDKLFSKVVQEGTRQ